MCQQKLNYGIIRINIFEYYLKKENNKMSGRTAAMVVIFGCLFAVLAFLVGVYVSNTEIRQQAQETISVTTTQEIVAAAPPTRRFRGHQLGDLLHFAGIAYENFA